MTKAMKVISYPSTGFLTEARKAFESSGDVIINVPPGWQARLLSKTLEFWPKKINDNERMKDASRFYFGATSCLLFSLFHAHVHALTCGRTMSHTNTSGGISIKYNEK